MSALWDRQEGESSKAFAAFVAYLDLGPDRSIVKAIDSHLGQDRGKTGAKSRISWWERWSSQFRWVARAEAFDEHELQEKIATRATVRERLRQRAIDNADMALGELVALCSFEDEHRPSFAAKVRHAASMDVLKLAGVDLPKKHEVSGPDGGAVVVDKTEVARRVDEILDGLSEEQIAKLQEEIEP